MGQNISNRLQLSLGFRTSVYVSLDPMDEAMIRNRQALSVDTEVAKGATSITLSTGLTSKISKGNALLFEDSDGMPYLVKVDADAEVADTTLTVQPTASVIPAAAVAYTPAEIYCRTDASIDQSYNNEKVYNFNTGGAGVITATTQDNSLSLPGSLTTFDAGSETIRYAAKNRLPVWVARVIPPDSTAEGIYLPDIVYGLAAVTSMGSDSPAEGIRSNDIELEFSGTLTEITLTPVP